ncbi:MAG: PulJ/GspJ family protein [Chthoniobacterales bacterium]
MKLSVFPAIRGFTLVEVMVASAVLSVFGLVIFALLSVGTILGAKNTAVNVAHEQARTAMLQMTQDLHAAVSPLELVDVNGKGLALNPDGSLNNGPAEGIAFQLLISGPLRVVADAAAGTSTITVDTTGATIPIVGERLIIRTHSIEADISAVSGNNAARILTLVDDQGNPYKLPVPIIGSAASHITGIVNHHCSYIVVNGALQWTGPTTKKTFAVLGNDITNPKPFTTPVTPTGSSDLRFVAAIDLSTADSNYSNRGFKSANILLNGRIPSRAQLTDGL